MAFVVMWIFLTNPEIKSLHLTFSASERTRIFKIRNNFTLGWSHGWGMKVAESINTLSNKKYQLHSKMLMCSTFTE